MTTKATPRPVGFAAPPHRFAVSAERTHGSITAPADESAASCDSAPDSANRCRHCYSNTGAASPARTSSHHCFTSPTVTMSSSLPLPLGRGRKPAVVSQPAAQSRHPHSDRIRSPPGESRRGQLGRAGAPMAAPSRRLRRLRFLPKLDRAWDSGDHLAATLIGVGLLRVVERSRCGYPLRGAFGTAIG